MSPIKNQSGTRQLGGSYYREGKYHSFAMTIDGKRVVRRAQTEAELNEKVSSLIASLETKGKLDDPRRRTVAQRIEAFIEDVIADPSMRKYNTYRSYRNLADLHIVGNAAQKIAADPIAKMESGDLNHEVMQAYVGRLRRKFQLKAERIEAEWKRQCLIAERKGLPHPKRPNPASGNRTINQCIGLIGTACRINKGDLRQAGLVLPPGCQPRTRHLKAKDAALFIIELRRIGNDGRPFHRYGGLIECCLNTGLRVSEARGLEKDHVNLKDGVVKVEGQAGKVRSMTGVVTAEFTATKSDRTRIVPLNSAAKAVLQRQFERNAEEGYTGPLVFPSAHGRVIHERCINTTLEKVTQAVGLPHLTIHDIRRSYITHLARNEPNAKIVQSIAGHSNIATTLNHYVLAHEEDILAAANKVDFG